MGAPLARSHAPRTNTYRICCAASEVARRCQRRFAAPGVELPRRAFSTSSCDEACARKGCAREAQSAGETRVREANTRARRAGAMEARAAQRRPGRGGAVVKPPAAGG
eukprot:4732505-Prymnesium_polylepis.1